jgi:preprotein translocase subunit SecF
MVKQEIAWQLIKINASKARKTGMIWHSLVDAKEYQVLEISKHKIIIKREDQHKTQDLTENTVIKAIKKFNAQNCKVKRGSLISPTVAEETAFVLFHPNLTWDAVGEYIVEI